MPLAFAVAKRRPTIAKQLVALDYDRYQNWSPPPGANVICYMNWEGTYWAHSGDDAFGPVAFAHRYAIESRGIVVVGGIVAAVVDAIALEGVVVVAVGGDCSGACPPEDLSSPY